ncbi:GpE family phage tail protein [Photorhabdus luminescens]|uniref:GpE family phage tail protein n=2 Tax=Photorhabdus TaxID=29487 RepID=A0A2S8PW72_9GAMM|nr:MULTISPECIES: GpE family phage tail protein [Photorhabdus]MBS9428441.1 GpE family phage tail protein [Photorhabdus akhurstii]PQQ23218.1 GpE family phage tail protein [Photorhabdus hindustanensis]QXF31748.1 GpE family phage tail protein [Photorhabdus akhurstii]UJD73542.1 GpE family phage tail protein [Photorhabdus luminescens]
MVADIATVFHWSPAVTNEMSLPELLDWRHRAILRSGAENE